MVLFRNLFVFVFYYSLVFDCRVVCRISDKRRCVDADCSVPISLATTLLRYNADDERLLSFPPNVKAHILSKEAGDNPTLWEAEINGKRGYVPKGLMRENKVFVKSSEVKFIVPTGRDDIQKHNKTLDNTEGTDLHKTPELPAANSKGMFSMIGGVSADSVPPNSPDIDPQSTRKFQIFDGTTIYDDRASETPEKPPEKSSEDGESPATPLVPPLEETKLVGENVSEEILAISPQPNSDIKEFVEKENKLSSEESKQTTENLNNVESISQSQDNDAKSTGSASETSIIDDLVSSISNFMSSGTGEHEKEEEDDEYFEEESSGEEGSYENDGSGLEESIEGDTPPSETVLKETPNEIEPTILKTEAPEPDKEISSNYSHPAPEIVSKAPSLINILNKDGNPDLPDTIISSPDSNEVSNDKPLGEIDVPPLKTEDEKSLQSTISENIANPESESPVETLPNNLTNSVQGYLSGKVLDTLEPESPEPAVGKTDVTESLENEESPSRPNMESGQESSETTKSNIDNLFHQHLQPHETKILLQSNPEIEVPPASKEEDIISPAVDEVFSNTSSESAVKPNVEEPKAEVVIPVEENITEHPYEDTEIPLSTESSDVEQKTTRELLFGSRQIIKDSIEQSESTSAESVTLPEPASVQIEPQPHNVPDNSDPTSSLPTIPSHPPQQAPESPMYSSVPIDVPAEEIREKDDLTVSETTAETDSVESQVTSTPDQIDAPQEALNEEPQETPKKEFLDEVTEAHTKNVSLPPQYEDILTGSGSVEDRVVEAVPTEDPSGGVFSWFSPVFDLFSSSDSNQAQPEDISSSEEALLKSDSLNPSLASYVPDESCQADGVSCDSVTVPDIPVHKDVTWQESFYSTEMSSALELLDKIPLETTLWLIITAVVVLIFSLGHYYIEAHRRDGPLVAVINKLEREVLILKKESCILEDRLNTAQQELEAWTINSSKNDAEILELRDKLEKSEALKAELEEQNALLEREVETVTESGMEMHRLLSESLSSQDGSQVLLSTVETLREKLEHQEDEIVGLSQTLSRKNLEAEELEEKLAQAAEVARQLEERIIAITRNKEEEALQLKDQHRQLIAQLEEVVETKALDETRMSADRSRMRLTIEELQKALAEKDSELDVLKEVVKQLRSTDSNEKMDALFDVVGVRAQLQTTITQRNDFRERFMEEEGARKLLEGHMKKITQEVVELKNSFETAEKEKIEALTKLQVLSNYFKEKESQLQKELGLQESMWLQKQSDDHSIYEQMRSLREENEKYNGETKVSAPPSHVMPSLAEVKTKKKSNPKISPLRQSKGLQNESLKKEIVEQESSFKIQLANLEQKSHENWVTSRQAERKLKEAQQEAAQLRNRLTSAANYSLDDTKQIISESNGDPSSPPPSLMFPPTTSPPFMLYNMPPHGDFVPPPPLVSSPYHSDSRPPPLGRISSPPLDPRFSPPPPLPYPPYDYPPYGHHSPSPPPPLPSHSLHRNVHKPQPREVAREQKEHGTPTYSPDTDKSMRRNKR